MTYKEHLAICETVKLLASKQSLDNENVLAREGTNLIMEKLKGMSNSTEIYYELKNIFKYEDLSHLK